MSPRRARAAPAPPRRLLAICNNLGLLPELFFPADAGPGYAPSPYLEILQPHRARFTVLSGVSHPGVDGQHASDICFLTAAPHPGSGLFRNGISLDQVIAEQVGPLTRFPSLTLAVNTRKRSLSWTASGVAIPPEDRPSEVFKQLFLQGSANEVAAQVRKLDTGRSVLDAVAADVARLRRGAGPRDRERLDQYLEGVRALESRLQAARGWERRPRPIPPGPGPGDVADPAAYFEKTERMYHVARLALESDSTRAITIMLNSLDSPVIDVPGATITEDYHSLSHHGKLESKRRQLQAIDRMHMKLVADLLAALAAAHEGGEPLLDRTVVLYGSNLGDGNAHLTTNMPVLVAGGGFRHGQHVAFDPVRNCPLPNLFVSILRRLGLPDTAFASATGPMRGLDEGLEPA
jgi:hypothetical protein